MCDVCDAENEEIKPGDRLVCEDAESAEPLVTPLPGYSGLESGRVYTVRSVPVAGYVTLMEHAPEVRWQQSRFRKD